MNNGIHELQMPNPNPHHIRFKFLNQSNATARTARPAEAVTRQSDRQQRRAVFENIRAD